MKCQIKKNNKYYNPYGHIKKYVIVVISYFSKQATSLFLEIIIDLNIKIKLIEKFCAVLNKLIMSIK